MKIIGALAKQPSWGLELTRGEFHTGYTYTNHRSKSNKKSLHPVVVVELEIRPDYISRGRSSTIMHLVTSNDKTYSTSPTLFSEMITALLDGDFKQCANGFIRGNFTFKKQGSQVYLSPYLEDLDELINLKEYRAA